MNIKDEFTAIMQDADKGKASNKLHLMSKIILFVSELTKDGAKVPENVLEQLTNEQQRSVLLLAATGLAMVLEGK